MRRRRGGSVRLGGGCRAEMRGMVGERRRRGGAVGGCGSCSLLLVWGLIVNKYDSIGAVRCGILKEAEVLGGHVIYADAARGRMLW